MGPCCARCEARCINARRDSEMVAFPRLYVRWPIFPVMSVESSPNRRRKERCGLVGVRASSPSQKVVSLSAEQSRSVAQCRSTPEMKMIYSRAVPVTSARNHDSKVAAPCKLTSRCLRTTFKIAVGIGELGWQTAQLKCSRKPRHVANVLKLFFSLRAYESLSASYSQPDMYACK